MKTTYCVSGFMRTGTSMMMRSLEAGGMEVVHNNEARRKFLEEHADDDYHPNPGELYELMRDEYLQPHFPRMYEGKLLKCLQGGLARFVAGRYKIVFMRRDYEEIKQSYAAFNPEGKPPRIGADRYLSNTEDILGIVRQRRDIQVTELWYQDVINDPPQAFGRLATAGWPISVANAAAVVDQTQWRYRLEQLDVGA